MFNYNAAHKNGNRKKLSTHKRKRLEKKAYDYYNYFENILKNV